MKSVYVGMSYADSIYKGSSEDENISVACADNSTVYGDGGNDIITFAENVTGKMYGDSGNDTISGGAGSDIFLYSTGNNVITDYRVNTDKIKLSGTTIKNAKVDIVFTTSKGTLTLKGAAGKITFTK